MKLGSSQRAFLDRIVQCDGTIAANDISLTEINLLRTLLSSRMIEADDIPARNIAITAAGRAALEKH